MSSHYNLFHKTELTITNVIMQEVNLNLIAGAVANILGLSKESVLVVDVRDDFITLDILEKKIEAARIFGQKQVLLDSLSQIDGLTITEQTDIKSNGILGSLVMDESQKEQVLTQAAVQVDEMTRRLRQRALICSTGFEVKKGMIEDTNTPYIIE